MPKGQKSARPSVPKMPSMVSVPAQSKPNYIKALQGKASLRNAIKAKCSECVGFQDIRVRVGGCTVYGCPLWSYRPFQDAQPTPQTVVYNTI
jgi:hypothetical protein